MQDAQAPVELRRPCEDLRIRHVEVRLRDAWWGAGQSAGGPTIRRRKFENLAAYLWSIGSSRVQCK